MVIFRDPLVECFDTDVKQTVMSYTTLLPSCTQNFSVNTHVMLHKQITLLHLAGMTDLEAYLRVLMSNARLNIKCRFVDVSLKSLAINCTNFCLW